MNLSEAEELSAILVGGSGDEATDFDAAFSWDGIEADEVEGEVFEGGEIMSGVAGTGAHLVIGKGDIHAPVELVFDGPVLTNGTSGALGIRGQTGNVETLLDAGLAFDGSLGLDDDEGLEIRPLRWVMQAIELVEDEATAMLDPAMVFLDGFKEAVRRLAGRHGLEDGEEVADRIGQRGLVVLDRENIVGLLVANGLRDAGLGSHRIDRDDASFEREHLQQERNGCLLVRFFRRRNLPEHQSRPGSERANQMQWRRIDLAGPPAGLAVNRHDRIRPQRRQHTADPAPKCRLKLFRLDQAEQAS